MKSIKFLLFAFVAFALFVTACKEDDTTLTKTEMLTGKSWKVVSFSFDDSIMYPEECEKDDFIKFKTDGTSEFNPGTIKCDPSDSIEMGTWKFANNETKLVVDEDTFSIFEFTSSKLVIGEGDSMFSIKVTLNSF